MEKINKVLVLFLMLSSLTAIAELREKYWLVKRGDTLFGIARSVFPKDSILQAKLRTEIIKLNQKVFITGAGGLTIGAELVLPEFAYSQSHLPLKKPAKAAPLKKESSSLLLSKNQWKIKAGDTLYSIGRAIYPRSNKKQAILRKDIVRINPQVFNNGVNKMEVGVLLRLPEYVVKVKKSQSKIAVTAVKQKPQTIISATIVENNKKTIEQKREAVTPVPEMDGDDSQLSGHKQVEESSRVTNYQTDDFTSQISISVGYSSGGDLAVPTQSGHEVAFGSGAHLRLAYDGLWNNKKGYRIALGYQLDKVTAGNDSGQLDQTYLQAMYLYNTPDSLFGIGASYHDNILLTIDKSSIKSEVDYEPVIGLVMMYEIKHLFGENIMGVSYTQVESEHSINQIKADMSRTEIYYRWVF